MFNCMFFSEGSFSLQRLKSALANVFSAKKFSNLNSILKLIISATFATRSGKSYPHKSSGKTQFILIKLRAFNAQIHGAARQGKGNCIHFKLKVNFRCSLVIPY
jgi:hypothetical protein